MKVIFTYLIKRYQNNKKEDHVDSCIFIPCCSEYALLALKKHNFIRASFLIVKRIYNCDVNKSCGGHDYP